MGVPEGRVAADLPGRATACPLETPFSLGLLLSTLGGHGPNLPGVAARPGPAQTSRSAYSRDTDTHERIRRDRFDKSGTVTLGVAGRLRHIGIGRAHARTHVFLLTQDLEVRIGNAVTGELLRELTIDTSKDYPPRTPK